MKNITENLTIDELTEALIGGGFTKKEATQRSKYTFKKVKSRDASDLLKFAMNANNLVDIKEGKKTHSLNKDKVRSASCEVLGVLSKFTQNERSRILKMTMDMNNV